MTPMYYLKIDPNRSFIPYFVNLTKVDFHTKSQKMFSINGMERWHKKRSRSDE